MEREREKFRDGGREGEPKSNPKPPNPPRA
jgi:hypothetical protein